MRQPTDKDAASPGRDRGSGAQARPADLTEDMVRRLISATELSQTEPDCAAPPAPDAGTPGAIRPETSPRPGRARQLVQRAGLAARAAGLAVLRHPQTPRRAGMAVIACVIIVYPWLIVTLLVLTVLVSAIAYLTLGPDRVGERVAAWHAGLRARDPERAETLRRRAAAVSRFMSVLAARLPDRWTSGLYLPDFEDTADRPEILNSDPFDRLSVDAVDDLSTGRAPGLADRIS